MGRLAAIGFLLAGLAPALPAFAEYHAGPSIEWRGADTSFGTQEPYASFFKSNPTICCIGCPTKEQLDRMIAQTLIGKNSSLVIGPSLSSLLSFPVDGVPVEDSLENYSAITSIEFPTLSEFVDE